MAAVPGSRASCSELSSPSPPKCAEPTCSPMQISVMRSAGTCQRAEHREDLDDLQLVVEVGLEPQHEVAGAVLRERAVAPLELGERPDVVGVLAREEARADPAQLGVRDVGHRALVEHVAPREHRVGEAGAEDAGHRRVAVGDVQRRGGRLRRPLGDHVGAGGGVGLARLGHPGADAPLELRLLGHRSSPATRPARSPSDRRRVRSTNTCLRPRGGPPFASVDGPGWGGHMEVGRGRPPRGAYPTRGYPVGG